MFCNNIKEYKNLPFSVESNKNKKIESLLYHTLVRIISSFSTLRTSLSNRRSQYHRLRHRGGCFRRGACPPVQKEAPGTLSPDYLI